MLVDFYLPFTHSNTPQTYSCCVLKVGMHTPTCMSVYECAQCSTSNKCMGQYFRMHGWLILMYTYMFSVSHNKHDGFRSQIKKPSIFQTHDTCIGLSKMVSATQEIQRKGAVKRLIQHEAKLSAILPSRPCPNAIFSIVHELKQVYCMDMGITSQSLYHH